MQTLELLLNTSIKLFMRYGIKSVSMDDISREMGISKKTLYQYVDDKRDLVYQAVGCHFSRDKVACDFLLADETNAIKQLLNLAHHITQTLGDMNPSTIYDLQKYYPDSWKQVEAHQQDYIINCIKSNIENGKKDGLYRSETDSDVVAKLYITLIDSSLHAPIFQSRDMNHSKLLTQIIDYHLHALMSEKGRKYLAKHKESLTV